jgi:biopolymer transport protein ExbD
MRERLKRHRHGEELNITAFLNLMVILIPFLLITAAFSRFSIIELYLPPASEGTLKAIKELQLEVIIRKDSLEVADQQGGLIRRLKQSPLDPTPILYLQNKNTHQFSTPVGVFLPLPC